jgi:hypothetical protein
MVVVIFLKITTRVFFLAIPCLVLTLVAASTSTRVCSALMSNRPFAFSGPRNFGNVKKLGGAVDNVGIAGNRILLGFGSFRDGANAALCLSQTDENFERGKIIGAKISTATTLEGSADVLDEDAGSNSTTNGTRQTSNETSAINFKTICRIAASADGKIPAVDKSASDRLSSSITKTSDKIDAIYNAINNQHLNSLSIMDDIQNNATTIQTLTESLQNSGFIPLSQRDLDLCAALNPGYLLRLSIAPDLKNLDPDVHHEFYPLDTSASSIHNSKSLFGGRVLIFRRGYNQEITTRRLLLPKLDYLQYSLVQRSASRVARRISEIDSSLSFRITNSSQSLQRSIQSTLDGWKDKIKDMNDEDGNENGLGTDISAGKKITNTASRFVKHPLKKGVDMLKNATSATGNSLNATLVEKKIIKLERYTSAGTGSRTRSITRLGKVGEDANSKFMDPDSLNIDVALNPFLVCEIDSDDGYGGIDTNGSALAYSYGYVSDGDDDDDDDDDDNTSESSRPQTQLPIRLLKRISIANLVDFFSDGGRRRLIKSLFSISELVEPTYEEIVVIWRPLPEPVKKKRVFVPPVPKFVYNILEVFGVEHKLPQQPLPEPEPDPLPIEIRTFDRVPMANLLAVLPKTKLIFRPADALIFDLVNVFSLLAVLASQKFDSPKLDIIALVSVSLWFTRTFFRYSNKLARYDLLVNKFLTQKISHRNIGALKYIANEAAVQRARRASLVHGWLAEDYGRISKKYLHMSDIIKLGAFEVNKRMSNEHPVYIDVQAALDDLVDLGLIRFSVNGLLKEVETGDRAMEALAELWNEIFRII